MTAARVLWAARLRAVWKPLVVLVVVAALGIGSSVAAMAGARRTLTAHDELLEQVNAFDLGITAVVWEPERIDREVRAIEGVEDFSQIVGFFDMASPDIPEDVGPFWFGPYGGSQKTVDRPVLYEGRLGEAADEVAVNTTLAESAGLEVGDELSVVVLDQETFAPVGEDALTITGIMGLAEAAVEDEADANAIVYLSPAYVEREADRVLWGQGMVRVEPGARPEVGEGIAALGMEQDQDRISLRRQARNSVQVLVFALAGLGLLVGVTTVVVAAQSASRLSRRRAADEVTLTALGIDARQRRLVDLFIGATVAVPAVLLGVGLAVVASSTFPVGSLRDVPSLRGTQVDVVVLGLVAVVMGLAIVVTTVIVAAGHRRRLGRPATTGTAPGPLGSRATVATALRLATGSRSLAAVVAALAVAMTAAVAAITFTGSLDRLVDDPARSGLSWDLLAREPFTPLHTDDIEAAIRAADGVERATGLSYSEARVDGRGTVVSIWESIEGPQFPPLLSGRLPSAPFEALVGEDTRRELGVDVGDRISLSFIDFGPDGDALYDEMPDLSQFPVVEHEFTVVGTGVSPAIGESGTDVPRLGNGILLDARDVDALLSSEVLSEVYIFDLADGVDPEDFEAATFPDGLPDDFGRPTEWLTSADPSEVVEAASARPALVLGALAVGAAVVATVAHGLLGFVRDRRRTYGVLSAIGFTPRQIRTTMVWQGSVAVVLATLVSVPLGVASGRLLWQAFASRIGVVADPSVPTTAIAGAVVLTVLGALVASLVPARRAIRSDAVSSLRQE